MSVSVFVEIPEGSSIKYEVDETTGQLTVDRVLPTAMRFPFSYGYIQGSKGADGDPLDVLLFVSQPIQAGVAIKCEVIGLLEMEDEGGIDHKVVCVPVAKVDFETGTWTSLDDIPAARKEQIRHFFEHYKDLEKGKWVKLSGWKDAATALTLVEASMK